MLTPEDLERMKALREWMIVRFRRHLGMSKGEYRDLSILLSSMEYLLGKIDTIVERNESMGLVSEINILDLGAGFSTVALRMFVSNAHFDTVDHDPKWLEFVGQLLSQRGLDYGSMFPRDEFKEMSAHPMGVYDVILVDHGPTMEVRLNDLDWISKLLRPDGMMFIDDFRRSNKFGKQCVNKLKGLGFKCAVEDAGWAHSDRGIALATRE